MNLHFTNQASHEEIKSDEEVTCKRALELLHRLTAPKSTLIMRLPSGLGLDFELQQDGLLTVEFYEKEISNASVSMEVAERIVKRAFEIKRDGAKELYADLIKNWNF